MDHCCDAMGRQVEHACDRHPDPFDCPDHLVYRSPSTGACGLIVHDGGRSFIRIDFCPWCGSRLPPAEDGAG